jgi:hypothetical protein
VADTVAPAIFLSTHTCHPSTCRQLINPRSEFSDIFSGSSGKHSLSTHIRERHRGSPAKPLKDENVTSKYSDKGIENSGASQTHQV